MEDYLKIFTSTLDTEFEVRFGTQQQTITKIDFNRVVQKLKSLGFYSYNSQYLLKIQNQFIDSNTGYTKMSSIRTEINGLASINEFCKTDKLVDKSYNVLSYVNFIKKSNINRDGQLLKPIDYKDLNFRISIQEEKPLTENDAIIKSTIKDWNNSKKIYRLMKRSTFRHKEYALKVDMSIVKTSKKSVRGKYIPEFSFTESNCLNSDETYEIEIECLRPENEMNIIVPNIHHIRKTIKIILSGLQSSNFPIGQSEIDSVKSHYYELIHGAPLKKKLYPRNFIGPSSISLELENIQDNKNNILSGYVVTDKADGIRKLLYIHTTGKIYTIDTNMNVQFTGVKTTKHLNTIMDGEHIIRNKKGEYYNHFAAFDIYILSKKDVRSLPFIDDEKECRLKILTDITKDIIKDTTIFQISVKTFYNNASIFESCNAILTNIKSGIYEYETDGLIFTPSNLGVGQEK